MSYTKTTWADRIDDGNKYNITDNGDGTSRIEYAGTVTREGTPVNASNLNHMETGIADAHAAVSDLSTQTGTALNGKQDKENGKGLSSNDYTTSEKNKLAGLSNYDDTTAFNTMVRADAPDEDGYSQLYKTVNGVRTDIDPKTSGGSGGSGSPYIYLTKAEYRQITPVTGQLYWVIDTNGEHGVYLNGSCVEGTNVTTAVYGVTWAGGASSALTRTDDAADFSDPVPALSGTGGSSPFDSCYPWNGMEEVTIGGNVLIKIPKFWYKVTKNGSAMTFRIAAGEKPGFHVSPAHADRGDGVGERDYVYIGKYKCSSSNWKSVSGVLPKVNITRSAARTGITGLGTGYYLQDFAMFWTTRLLYLVEFADWNSQSKIGFGGGDCSSEKNTGAADSMTYHTGTMQSSRDGYGQGVKYRGIEDLWSNVYEYCDGIRFSDTTVYAYNKPSEYSDTSGGTNVGTRPTNSYIPTAFNMPSAAGYEWAMYPSAEVYDSTYSKYITDKCAYNSSGTTLTVGGCYNHYKEDGMFRLSGYGATGDSSPVIGARLQYLPAV